MTKNQKAAIFNSIYLIIFFSIAALSMQVFSILVFSLGVIFVVELFSKFFIKFLKMPKKFAILISILIIFISLIFLLVFLIPTVIGEVSNFINFLNGIFEKQEWRELFPEKFDDIEKNVTEFLITLRPKIISFINDALIQMPNLGGKIGSFIFYLVLITIYGSFYFDSFKLKAGNLFPKSIRNTSISFLKDLYVNLKSFVISTLFAALFVGIGAFIIMNILGVKYSLLMSFWAALTNFIPIVGVIFEFIPLILVGISSGLTKMLILLLIMIILHTSAFIFFLYVMKGSARINPVAVIISILIFGYIFGFVGPIIAVPIGISIKVFWKHFISPTFERS
ncbi:AI-2E family transporter [Oceanotoga sp.]|uniref:AI-2E family transporter n=1 Tax=Oceanotoga sp. TaxID=2108366 RepID=UPI00280404C9|nr:AI-2E family transporter [Oceanotoga sp.]